MSGAPSISNVQQQLKARYRRELREFDNRPQQYRQRWVLTPVGAALLLHRAVEAANRYAEPIAGEDGGEA